jgi:hypothetical protein
VGRFSVALTLEPQENSRLNTRFPTRVRVVLSFSREQGQLRQRKGSGIVSATKVPTTVWSAGCGTCAPATGVSATPPPAPWRRRGWQRREPRDRPRVSHPARQVPVRERDEPQWIGAHESIQARLGRVLINRQPNADLDVPPNVRYWGYVTRLVSMSAKDPKRTLAFQNNILFYNRKT